MKGGWKSSTVHPFFLEISSGQFLLFLNFSFEKIFTRKSAKLFEFFICRPDNKKRDSRFSSVKLALFLSVYFVCLFVFFCLAK